MRTGYIYRLWSPGSTEFYIGSTINLKDRKHKHKCSCTNAGGKRYNLPVYQHIRSNGGWDAWRLDLEHTVQFNNRCELNRVEGEYIRRLKPSLNGQIPGRTPAEYRRDNKRHIAEKDKRYHQNNKATIAEKAKRYRETNKQAIAAKKKQYHEANKDKIKERINKKYNCLCGGKYTLANKSRHFKSLKHRAYAEYIKLYEYIVQT